MPRGDRANETPQARERRLAIYHHNRLSGNLGLARHAMDSVIASRTTSDKAKDQALHIRLLLMELCGEVQANRVLDHLDG